MYRIFFIIIACYLLVRFIFGFVIPVVTAMLNVKKKMNQMQGEMSSQHQSSSQNGYSTNDKNASKTSKPASSDYIEFEEIK